MAERVLVIAVVERCGVLVGPHSGFGMAALAVGTLTRATDPASIFSIDGIHQKYV